MKIFSTIRNSRTPGHRGERPLRKAHALAGAVPAPNGISARQMNASKPSLDPIQLNVIVLQIENAPANFG